MTEKVNIADNEDFRLTPMMKQYQQSKNEMPADAVLLFRMGDFYEIFFDDAPRVSMVLDIALTKRAGVPMCGFPYHALDNYLPRLIEAGLKVGIAEQMEDPKLAKGIVKRQVTRIITPGTIIDSIVLEPGKNNFLVALVEKKDNFGLACIDISTGEFKVTELSGQENVETELNRLDTKECLVPTTLLRRWQQDGNRLTKMNKVLWTAAEDWTFDYEHAEELLKRHFRIASLDGFGCRELRLAVCAAGAVLHYAAENLRQPVKHLQRLQTYYKQDYMQLDSISQRNLELVEPMFTAGSSNTLLHVLNQTVTPMGSRLLRDWILHPLCARDRINARLDAVEWFKNDPMTLTELRELIGTIRDLERIIGRLNIGSANARDMLALASSLGILPDIKNLLRQFSSPMLDDARDKLHELPELVQKIESAIFAEPPLSLTDGGIICEGHCPELDELRQAAREGKSWLSQIQLKEQERTGIKSLKVRFNNVFGYFIEITKSHLSMAPADYIRKQTLVNAERFITPELKELEAKILGAEEKSKALEFQLFQELREYALQFTASIQETAATIAVIDTLAALAEAARKYNYIRPGITDDEQLLIVAGRHPVLDAAMQGERFIPNDTLLDGETNRMMIITGPNMAGKSTYIRQTAMIAIMAQMGSFVPASEAIIGMADRIFTRVGAADDIARGQSTFMVEMVETANILNHATPKSLVILDEIGRGTSTFDGLSIAWAVAEFLHDVPHCRTQFATHYHELTELSLTKTGAKNYNVAVKEYGDQVIFLRQIVPGGTDKSYGIHVAKLAGLPPSVIARANEILDNLENNAMADGGLPALTVHQEKIRESSNKYQAKSNSKTGDSPDIPFQPSLL